MLSCEDASVWYPIHGGLFNRTRGYVKAVNGVTLHLREGETLGLVGESGCGKSTLGRALTGLEKLHSGRILCDGQDIAIINRRDQRARALRRNLQMVFQDPFSSLDPRMSALQILCEGLEANHAYAHRENREDAAMRLLREVGLPQECLYRFPHEFSGGQRQRLSIARALALTPKYIVCDEPVSALDVSVQSQIIRLLLDLQAKHGLSYLFISHDLSVIRLISHRIAVMYLGQIVEEGPSGEILASPMHPYTQALFSAIPVPGAPRTKQRIVLSGEVPSPAHPPAGCPFHTRCPHATAECRMHQPPMVEKGQRRVACHLVQSPGCTPRR